MCSLLFNANSYCQEQNPLFWVFWRENIHPFKEYASPSIFISTNYNFPLGECISQSSCGENLLPSSNTFISSRDVLGLIHIIVWCHFQILNIGLFHRTLSLLGLGHPTSLRSVLENFFMFFSLLIHMHLLFLFFLFLYLVLILFLLQD